MPRRAARFAMSVVSRRCSFDHFLASLSTRATRVNVGSWRVTKPLPTRVQSDFRTASSPSSVIRMPSAPPSPLSKHVGKTSSSESAKSSRFASVASTHRGSAWRLLPTTASCQQLRDAHIQPSQIHPRSLPMRSCRWTYPCSFLQYGCCSLAEESNAGHLAICCNSPHTTHRSDSLTYSVHMPTRHESSGTQVGSELTAGRSRYSTCHDPRTRRFPMASRPRDLATKSPLLQRHLSGDTRHFQNPGLEYC